MRKGFKDSSIGKIPDNWDVKSIGKITTVVRGASPRPKGDPRYYGGSVPRLMGKDVSRDGKYVIPQIDFLTDEGAKLSRFMPKGTLVMICSGDVGVPSILAVDACVHDGFLAFPKLSDSCDINYLFYIFDSLHQKFNSSATHGGVFTNLTTTIIKEFQIPVPPLPEQQKIADILSTVDAKIEVIDQQITETQDLKKGLMQRLLTKGIGHTEFKESPLGEIPVDWEVVKLGNIADVTAGGTPSTKEPNFWGGDIPWMNSGEINLRRIKAVEGRITELGLNNSSTKLIPSNSVLMALAGQGKTRGKVAVNELSLCTNQSLATIYNFQNADYEFIFQNLESRYSEIRKMSTGDGGRGGLNLTIIKSIPIALPPLREQNKISKILISFDEKLDVLLEKKENYQELKKGLMQQLLTGKVRVKV